MAKILNLIKDSIASVRVIHSIPGRMRIHVPYLKKIQSMPFNDMLWREENYSFISGVTSIEPNFTTGNILIHYNNDIISSKKILQMINNFTSLVLKHKRQILALEEHKIPGTIKRVREYLMNNENFDKGKKVELPHDLWI